MMEKDFQDILLALNQEGARYLVVGGYAVSWHSRPRTTKDIDLWVETSHENSGAVYRALARFGAPLGGMTAEDFYQFAQTGFQMGIPPVRIDILHHIDGVSFESAWKNRVATDLDGIPVHMISLDDLLTNKLESGRPQDIADIASMRKAAKTKQ